jgi:hypothetical protein
MSVLRIRQNKYAAAVTQKDIEQETKIKADLFAITVDEARDNSCTDVALGEERG